MLAVLIVAGGGAVWWLRSRGVTAESTDPISGQQGSVQNGSTVQLPDGQEPEAIGEDPYMGDAVDSPSVDDPSDTQLPSTDATFTPDPVTPEDSLADPDDDGLNNEQERQRGTDINKADTDGDGLTDGDEVRVRRTDPVRSDTDSDELTDGEEANRWKTDPLNPDTDGDSFTDGTEVKGGYNPLGEGRLP